MKMRRKIHGCDWLKPLYTDVCCVFHPPLFCTFPFGIFFHRHLQSKHKPQKERKTKVRIRFYNGIQNNKGISRYIIFGQYTKPILELAFSQCECYILLDEHFFSSLCFLCIASALFSLKDFKRLRSSNRSFTLIIN